jgi:hypothetical protein
MRGRRFALLSLLAVAATGCYHQVVQTGRPAGSTTVDKPMVATWLWGLIPATELDVRAQCPTGVAVVETETSFMNGLLAVITLGIFTPQHVKVTCASGTAMLPRNAAEINVAENANAAERAEAIREAIEQSLERHGPVVVRF